MRYTLTLESVSVALTVHDSGSSSDDILGDAAYTFDADDAQALAPMRLCQYNGRGDAIETTLAQAHEDNNGEAWADGSELRVSVDAGIAAVALLISRGTPFAFEVDTSGEYWAFHDTGHATDDVSADWEEGYADFPAVGAWEEDRANLTGAHRALAAGLSVETVLGELANLRAPFAERFNGEESTALADLLADGFESIPDDKRPRVSEVLEHVTDCARDTIERHDADTSVDDLEEDAREGASGSTYAERRAGLVLAALPEYADAAEDIERNPSLELRATYALESAIVAKVRELALCSECERERALKLGGTCSDCAPEQL